MGQQSNNRRNASLDEKKRRAAGRDQSNPLRASSEASISDAPAKGKTGGAFGRDGHAHRNQSSAGTGAGGGGGENSTARAAPIDVPPARRGH
jgi:hypothetical protein